MDRIDRNPLDDADEASLYELLGEAWYAQALSESANGHPVATNFEVGKREFEAIAPMLREALRQPFYQGVVARVTSLLQVEATWNMPSPLVVALARRRGFLGKKEQPD